MDERSQRGASPYILRVQMCEGIRPEWATAYVTDAVQNLAHGFRVFRTQLAFDNIDVSTTITKYASGVLEWYNLDEDDEKGVLKWLSKVSVWIGFYGEALAAGSGWEGWFSSKAPNTNTDSE